MNQYYDLIKDGNLFNLHFTGTTDTPLMTAIRRGHFLIVLCLLTENTDNGGKRFIDLIDWKINKDDSLEYCIRHGYKNIFQLITTTLINELKLNTTQEFKEKIINLNSLIKIADEEHCIEFLSLLNATKRLYNKGDLIGMKILLDYSNNKEKKRKEEVLLEIDKNKCKY